MSKRKDEQYFTTVTPRIRVLVYPFVEHFKLEVGSKNNMAVDTVEITSAVLDTNYSKTKTEPSGTFSITLKASKNWNRILRPGDWMAIFISSFLKEDTQITNSDGLKCLGIIDRVSKQRTITIDGKKDYTYKIFGRDFGKIFERTQFYYNPYTPKAEQQLFFIGQYGMKITGSPTSFLRSYINAYLGDGKLESNGIKKDKLVTLDQMRIPEPVFRLFNSGTYTGKFTDILYWQVEDKVGGKFTPEGYSLFIPPKRAIDTNLWEALLSVANTSVNEMFICLRYFPKNNAIVPTLVFRKLPYKQDTFGKLPYHVVQDNMIVAEDLGYSDHERYNWINIDQKNAIVSQIKQWMVTSSKKKNGRKIFPYVNIEAIQRYGLLQMHLETEFAWPEQGDTTKSQDNMLLIGEKFQEQLIEWWENYYRCENGTIILKGFSEGVDRTELITELPPLTGPSSKLKFSIPSIGFNVSLPPLKTFATKLVKKTVYVDHFNIGDNIYLSGRDRLYQLEGVNYDWKAPGELTITLTVTRGVAVKSKGNGSFDRSTFKYIDEVEQSNDPEIGLTEISRKNKKE